ncbi:E3 SUMO-protein ligase ZBED1-like [Saccostrea echinata]|uniref:E3 SUMO-protein ligase ZBED1-like n=1 Tax=Saccostrea echinata TaxID=191078 RepID=UPI002A834E07|nr:E3 SUMO-protein ligase ZBED1-like [Saccostrea echinata]
MVSDNATNITKAGDLLKCELHLGCYAHTLNLAVQKCLGVQSVARLLARVRKIVGFFHRSSVTSAMLKTQASLLELPYHKLVTDVTRWNSAYEMLDGYISMHAAVFSVLVSKDLKNKDKDLKFLTDDETTLSEDIITCFKPLKAMATTMCSETSPTASIILLIHYQLLDHVLLPKEGDSPTIGYATKENMLNKVSTLDPRFKTLPYLPEEDRLSVFDTLVRGQEIFLTRTQRLLKTEPVNNADNPPILEIPPLPVLATVSNDSAPHPPEENPIPPKIMKIESKSKPSSSTLGDILGDIYITKVHL